MRTLKRCGILSVIMAVAVLIPVGTTEARHRRGGGVNVWVGPGGVGYSRGYGGYYRPYYRNYQPYYYNYPSQSYYYSYPYYGPYYSYPNPYYGGYYYGSPGFQLYIGR